MTSHHITSHHTTSPYRTSYYITLHHITSHFITLHCILSHHITSHHITYVHAYIHTHYIHIFVTMHSTPQVRLHQQVQRAADLHNNQHSGWGDTFLCLDIFKHYSATQFSSLQGFLKTQDCLSLLRQACLSAV